MPFLCSAHIYLQPLYLVRDLMLYIGRLNNDYSPPKHSASPFLYFGHTLPCCLQYTLLLVFTSSESALYVAVAVLLGLTIIICACSIGIWIKLQRKIVFLQHQNKASRSRPPTRPYFLFLYWLLLYVGFP